MIIKHIYIALFHYNLSLAYERTAARELAIEETKKAIPIFEELKDTGRLFVCHSALMSRYNQMGKMDKTLAHYELAKKYVREKDRINAANLNNRIGIVYTNTGEFDISRRYFQENLGIYHEANDQRFRAIA